MKESIVDHWDQLGKYRLLQREGSHVKTQRLVGKRVITKRKLVNQHGYVYHNSSLSLAVERIDSSCYLEFLNKNCNRMVAVQHNES